MAEEEQMKKKTLILALLTACTGCITTPRTPLIVHEDGASVWIVLLDHKNPKIPVRSKQGDAPKIVNLPKGGSVASWPCNHKEYGWVWCCSYMGWQLPDEMSDGTSTKLTPVKKTGENVGPN